MMTNVLNGHPLVDIGDPPNFMGSLVFNVRIMEVGVGRPGDYLFSARVHDVGHWHQKKSRWHIYLLTFGHGMGGVRIVDSKIQRLSSHCGCPSLHTYNVTIRLSIVIRRNGGRCSLEFHWCNSVSRPSRFAPLLNNRDHYLQARLTQSIFSPLVGIICYPY